MITCSSYSQHIYYSNIVELIFDVKLVKKWEYCKDYPGIVKELYETKIAGTKIRSIFQYSLIELSE